MNRVSVIYISAFAEQTAEWLVLLFSFCKWLLYLLNAYTDDWVHTIIIFKTENKWISDKIKQNENKKNKDESCEAIKQII